MNLIGLYGPSRAGKDSVARFAVEDFGYEQRIMAASIREILLELDPWITDNGGGFWTFRQLFEDCHEDWDLVKKESREAVDYMIRLGQGCRDVLGENTWLDTVMPDEYSTKKIIISDVRQPNEYWAIKSRGGVIWKVIRPDTEKRGMDGLLDKYQFDAVIENSGTLEDLRKLVAENING